MYPDQINNFYSGGQITQDTKVGLREKLPKFNNKGLFGGIFVLALAISSVFLSQRILTPVGKPEKSSAQSGMPWTYPRPLNVIIVRYFDPTSLPQNKDPNQAKVMSDYFQGYIRGASLPHGNPTALPSVVVNVLDTYDYNEAAPGANVYWEDAFNTILSRQLTHSNDNGRTLCDRIVADKVDQVWFMADPTTGRLFKGPEFSISSKFVRPGALPTTFEYSIVPNQLFCGGSRSFGIMFLDLSRGETASLHSFGHYLEALLSTVQGYNLFYKKFMGINYSLSGINGEEILGVDFRNSCGSVHTPPNATAIPGTSPIQYKGYDYDSSLKVVSSCQNWNPDGTGAKLDLSNSTWKNSQYVMGSVENRYIMWWMQNMPNADNNLKYLNLLLPNWWDFTVDLDNTINAYLNNANYYMNSDLLKLGPTASCADSGGTTITCNAGSTLGASTESDTEGKVLQASTTATTGYGNLALVSLAYRSHTNPTTIATSVTYCGVPMFRIGGSTGRVKFEDQTVEMWYLMNPPIGDCAFTANYSLRTDEKTITSNLIGNVQTSNFIESVNSAGYNNPPGSNFLLLQKPGPKDTTSICTYSTDAKGGTNKITPSGTNWFQIWSSGYNPLRANIFSGIGMSAQRTTDNQLIKMQWNGSQLVPWAAYCVNLRMKQTGTATPPPSTPAPLPGVNLKINNSDGPVTTDGFTAITISWSSSHITSCTASGGWSGTKAANGSETKLVNRTNKFSIFCTGPNNAQVSDVVQLNIAYDKGVCWDKAVPSGVDYTWKDKCRGVFTSYTKDPATNKYVCALKIFAPRPLPTGVSAPTSTVAPYSYILDSREATQRYAWSDQGKPKTPCYGLPFL